MYIFDVRMIARLTILSAAACTCLVLSSYVTNSTEPSYLLGAGDKLRITVFEEPDLSGDVEVSTAGSISLPLIGQITAAGLNPYGVEKKIAERLNDGYLTNPQVTVDIIEYRPFYILGGVKTPGSYPYVHGMTVLNAVVLAGGYISELDYARVGLDVTRARETLRLLQGGYWTAKAREARLIAERDGLEDISFPKLLLRLRSDLKVAEIIDGEKRLFETGGKVIAGEIAVFESQVSQIRQGILALKAQLSADRQQLELIKTEIADVEKLVAQGYARKRSLTALQRNSIRTEGSHLKNLALIARAKQNVEEIKLQIVNRRNAHLDQVVDSLQEVQKIISDHDERMPPASDVLRQSEAELGFTRAGLAAAKGDGIIITRDSGGNTQDVTAMEDTPLLPGDIIRIPGFGRSYGPATVIGLTPARADIAKTGQSKRQ